VASVLKDITEQKEAERSLRLFRTLIDQSTDAVEVVDPETLRFLDVNEKACKDLGYSREELLTMTVFDINRDIDESVRNRVFEVLQRVGFVVREGIHWRKDGSKFPVETSLKLVQLERKYVITVSRDITERKQAEKALRESEDRYQE
jgi:PAS domain S-box-containing protein